MKPTAFHPVPTACGVPRRVAGQSGFTLVELMVSLVLGLVLLVGVIGIFSSSRQSYAANENLARLQENARVSFEMLAREIREAGNIPCGTRAMANVVRASGAVPWWADWAGGTVRGYDGTKASPMRAFGTASADRVKATDGIVIMRTVSDESAVKLVTAHDTAATTLNVSSEAGISAGDVVNVCDSSSAVLVRVQSTATGGVIKYDSSDNCSTNLGFPTGECGVSTPAKTFSAGSVVAKFDPAFWYVAVNSRGGRSLYRQSILSAQEMVPGVQDMQIEYLVRQTTAGVPTLATSWVPASDAQFEGTDGWTEASASQVIAVRLTLTLRSDSNASATATPLDRKFVTVAALRSRDQ
jgi:type IV pilus assembly protein PilW